MIPRRIHLAARDLEWRAEDAYDSYGALAPYDAIAGLQMFNVAGAHLCAARANARSCCYLTALRSLYRGWRAVRRLERMADRRYAAAR